MDECVSQTSPKRYTRPPIIERAIRIFADVPEDLFQEKLGEWSETVRAEFPHYTRHVEWNIQVSSQGDLPFIDPNQTTMFLRHRYWSCDPTQGHADWCLQLLRDSFILNLRQKMGEHSEQPGFSQLLERFDYWFQRWLKIFEFPKLRSARVQYWNRLDHSTLPNLATDKQIDTSKVLTVFAQTPLPPNVVCYVPPYQCTHSWLAKIDNVDYNLRAETESLEVTPIALQVRFSAERAVVDAIDLRKSVLVEHELISDAFNMFFTDKAKDAFGVKK